MTICQNFYSLCAKFFDVEKKKNHIFSFCQGKVRMNWHIFLPTGPLALPYFLSLILSLPLFLQIKLIRLVLHQTAINSKCNYRSHCMQYVICMGVKYDTE